MCKEEQKNSSSIFFFFLLRSTPVLEISRADKRKFINTTSSTTVRAYGTLKCGIIDTL